MLFWHRADVLYDVIWMGNVQLCFHDDDGVYELHSPGIFPLINWIRRLVLEDRDCRSTRREDSYNGCWLQCAARLSQKLAQATNRCFCRATSDTRGNMST